MKKNSLLSLIFIPSLLFLSCNQTPKNADKNKKIQIEISPNLEDLFESFIVNFKPISIQNLNELREEFNDSYLAKYDTTLEVAQVYIDQYLKNLNLKNAYYGFKTELPNKSILLTFLNHYGVLNAGNEIEIDTSFFVSCIFNDSHKLQGSFRSFGSDLSAAPPTYNMNSTFNYENDRLFITNYEYSIAKSPSEVKPIPGSDSIYLADLTTTKYCLNYATNQITLMDKSISKVKVVYCVRNPMPIYFKPID